MTALLVVVRLETMVMESASGLSLDQASPSRSAARAAVRREIPEAHGRRMDPVANPLIPLALPLYFRAASAEDIQRGSTWLGEKVT